MKTFLTILTFLTIFSGCSSKDAFFGFDMDQSQKLSASSLQSSKIVSKNAEVKGTISVIYLNEVYPKSFNGHGYFYIFIFTKEPKKLYDPKEPSESDMKLKLNSELPIKVERLATENRFSHLVDTKNEWNQYYLVAFNPSETIELIVEDFEDSNSVAAVIKYKKE
ncbi:hypothetical protein FCU45_04440 [Sulfurimonas crateris]|uniref:Lipoprotein n=1 Tax=Sulfurimonas crateris TaxID=2574727 RepID=A0A4U2Z7L4_9BACT|nr:hypothetical protein [Sulfurimonas crateris]TKI69865.1 hypothetical protein FCU45_04440 [Sulfurimonas crateris]